MTQEPKHPTYGTLDQLLEEVASDIRCGYELRIGLQGALGWFAAEYAKLKLELSNSEHDIGN